MCLSRLMPNPSRFIATIPLGAILVLCAPLQIVAALWWVDEFDTPNDATSIARNLIQTGEYLDYAGWRLYGDSAGQADAPLRMHQLPGEPLYLAAGFSWLPAFLWRFLHLPVVLLLVGSIMWCTRHCFGKPAAVAACNTAGRSDSGWTFMAALENTAATAVRDGIGHGDHSGWLGCA